MSAIDAQTSTGGRGGSARPPARYGAEVVERLGEGGGAVGVVRAVEQHLPRARRRGDVDELEAARPARGRVPAPAGGGRRPARCPAASRASSSASATATFAAWCRPRRPMSVGPSPGSVDPLRVAVPAEDRRRAGDRRAARRAARSAAGSRPAPRRSRRSPPRRRARRSPPSRARSPSTVGPSRSVWSSPTLVSTATPPSQACVASSRPPSPTSTSATSSPASREVAEHHGGQELELRRRPEARRDPVGERQHRPRRGAANVAASIGRPSTTIRSR